MKLKNDKEKNNLLIQDINSNDKAFTNKIFRYFYSLFQEKKEFKIFLKFIQIFIETTQFISYAFTSNHHDSWKMQNKNIKLIYTILSIFRLSIFMKYLKYKIYSIISYILTIFIFIINLIVLLNILFIDSSSKLYRYSSTIIRSLIDIIAIIFYIPITEIILLPIKCVNGKVDRFEDGEKCWKNFHYLNVTIGIIGAFLLFIWSIFMVNFSFYPFQNSMSTVRIYSNNDIIIITFKLILVLQYLLISNEYISISILFLASISMFVCCYNESTYNNNKLEVAIIIKNLLIFWTYFVLMISKIFVNAIANGFIYLLVFGAPIVIYLSIVIHREKDFYIIKFLGNCKNIKEFLSKAKVYMKLINSFIEKNQNMRSGNESEEQRNIILLRGNIKIHNIMCSNKDCPLTKFLYNEGNYNVQKQCLLNYMNIFFNLGLKMYPKDVNLLMLYINFNYSKRFNLNSVRGNLIQLKKIECCIKEKYIIYCMEQNIKNMKYNGVDLNIENDKDNDSQLDLTEQKYQKLKYLIENSIKLYGEFWGIFSTNVSSNINTTKLYTLGEKLNIYLNEMNNLWDNELKNKRISNEYQSVVQLYSKFLLEVLWDQKKSKEVYKKLNDENLNNYHLNDNKKLNEENNTNENNIEALLDNQDYIVFAEFDEKGDCKIIQSSASFAHFLSFQKIDLIGKPIEIIIPNILIEENTKFFEENLKMKHNGQNNQDDLSYSENDSNKNGKLVLVKSRMGYIFPLFASFKFLVDNDYSDSFLIKIKMENRESKSEYANYVLTNTDFIIENISSSSIDLGLSLDLLKKYVVKMDILIRAENNKVLNFYEKYTEFEEEPKKVIWVFPDVIYPKDNVKQNKEEEIEELIEKSSKKEFNLQIKTIKLNGNEIIAYLFKLTEIKVKINKKKFNEEKFIPQSKKNLIMFYLNTLSYARIYVVDKKSGLNNLKTEEIEKDNNNTIENNKLDQKKSKKRKKSLQISDDESSENSDKNRNNILTKEKIAELQVHNYSDIRNFIYSLPIYGYDVALERFRPNGDKYSASKITESLIKIHINTFCQRIDERLKIDQRTKKKKNKSVSESFNHIESPKSTNTDNHLFSTNESSSIVTSDQNTNVQGEDLNKGLSSDSSVALSNVFKANTIKYIRTLINFIFLVTLILLLVEFLITYNHMNKLKTKINFLNNGYKILSSMLYTKHYVTEGVLANALNSTYLMVRRDGGLSKYLQKISNELSLNRQEFTEVYDTFTSNELCKDYKNFMEKTTITIDTLTVNVEEKLILLFNSAMTRISSSINNLVSNPSLMVISNRDTFELMHNLINEYYINWEKAIGILLNDSKKATKLNLPIMFIMIGYIVISIIILLIFLKLLSRFSLDREKPINLFLTLKKVVFENLKNSAENFSNKLLNKFFGNEDNEEEAQQDYQANIQPSDINIVKFKAANEYNTSINKAFDFMTIIIIILIFLLLNLIYFMVKYFNFRTKMDNINQFISLFQKTYIAEIDFVLSLEIFKSYFFNKTIPILNNTNTRVSFLENFITLTNSFEDSIIYTSKTKSFLSGDYLEKYEKYYLGDYSELLDKSFVAYYGQSLIKTLSYGLKPIHGTIYEIIRYFTVLYCKSGIEDEDDSISYVLSKRGTKIYQMNLLTEHIIRKWYIGVIKLMVDSLYEYQDNTNLKYIILFVCLIIIVILYYFIIWRINEEKLNLLLKESANLINLIPQEIKNIIIEKLNE